MAGPEVLVVDCVWNDQGPPMNISTDVHRELWWALGKILGP